MNSEIEVVEIDEENLAELFQFDPGNGRPRPVYLELDLMDAPVTLTTEVGITGVTPHDVNLSKKLRFKIPPLKSKACNHLMHKLVPVMTKIADDFHFYYDGRVNRGSWSEYGNELIQDITDELSWDLHWNEEDIVVAMDADAWMRWCENEDEEASFLGIRHDSSDDELEAIQDKVENAAHEEGVVLTDTLPYLEDFREYLQKQVCDD